MKRDRENLKQLIKEAGLESLENLILSYARPSIRIYTEPVDEGLLAIGESKIGGHPDLPDDYDWASFESLGEKVSLPFIAQIRLSDMTQYDEENLLPKQGILYFFSGPRATHTSGAYLGKVLYYAGDSSQLKRRDFPADIPPEEPPPAQQGDRYRACKLSFAPEVNLDRHLEIDLEESLDIKLPDKDSWDKLYELLRQVEYREHPRVINRLLGTNDTKGDCLSYTGNNTLPLNRVLTEEEYEQAIKDFEDWQHLLQIDSDPNADMNWHDAGMIAFFIRRTDLKSLKFDNICWTFETG